MANFFNADYYFAAKAKQLSNSSDGKTWTAAEVKAEFAKMGITPEQHYLANGQSEGLQPNAYFNETEYLESKLKALQEGSATKGDWTGKNVADLKAEFTKMGITAAEHYEKAGAFETRADGTLLNPSNAFDANAYFAAKLAQLQEAGFDGADTMTVQDVVNALKAAGASPVSHFLVSGAAEAKADGVPLVQTVPSEQRMPNDPGRTAFGENVPSNYNPPSKAPAAAVAAPVTKPADVGGLSAAAPAAPSTPVKVPGDAGYIAPPATLKDLPGTTIILPTASSGTGPNASFIVVDNATGVGTVIKLDGKTQGTIAKVEKDANGNFVQPKPETPITGPNGEETNIDPKNDNGDPVDPPTPTPDPDPVDPPTPTVKAITLTGADWVDDTTDVAIKAFRTDAEGAAKADGDYVTFIIGTALTTNTKKSTAFKLADYDVFEFSQYQKVTVDAAVTAMTGLKPFTGKGVVFVAAAAGSTDESITADIYANNMDASLTPGTDGSQFSGGTNTSSGDSITLNAKDKAVYDIADSVDGFEKLTINGASGSGSTYNIGTLPDSADVTFAGSTSSDTLVISGGIASFAELKATQLTNGGGKDILKVTHADALNFVDVASGDYFGKLNDYAASGNQGFHTLLLDNNANALSLDLSKLEKYEGIAFGAGTALNTITKVADAQSLIVAGTNVNLKLDDFADTSLTKTVNLSFQNIDAETALAASATLKGTVELDAALDAKILNVTGSAFKDELILKAGSGDFATVAINANMGSGDDTVTFDITGQTSNALAFSGDGTTTNSSISGGSGSNTVALVNGDSSTPIDAAFSADFTNLNFTDIQKLDVSGLNTSGSNALTLNLANKAVGLTIQGSDTNKDNLIISAKADVIHTITTGSGDDVITYKATSGAFGIAADLGSGDDTLTLDLAGQTELAFVDGSSFVGGDGTDTLALTGTLAAKVSANFTNMTLTDVEILNVSGVNSATGFDLTFTKATELSVTGHATASTTMTMGDLVDDITYSGASALKIDTGKGADVVDISNGNASDVVWLDGKDFFTAGSGGSFISTNIDTITGFKTTGTTDKLGVANFLLADTPDAPVFGAADITLPGATGITFISSSSESAGGTAVTAKAIYQIDKDISLAATEDGRAALFNALFTAASDSVHFKTATTDTATKAVVIVRDSTADASYVFYLDSTATGDNDFQKEDIAYVATFTDIDEASTDFAIGMFA